MSKDQRGARRVVYRLLRSYVEQVQLKFLTTPQELLERACDKHQSSQHEGQDADLKHRSAP